MEVQAVHVVGQIGKCDLQRWPGWSAQGSATVKWIVCRLARSADPWRHVGRAKPDRNDAKDRLPNSCCHRQGQIVKMGMVRRSSGMARMRPPSVVKAQIAADRCARLPDAAVGMQIDLLVFHGTP